MADLATTIQTALSTQTGADERIECRVRGQSISCLGSQEIVNILNSIDPDQDIPQIFRTLIDGVSNDKIHLTRNATQLLDNFGSQRKRLWQQDPSESTPSAALKKYASTLDSAYPFAAFLKTSGCHASPMYALSSSGFISIDTADCLQDSQTSATFSDTENLLEPTDNDFSPYDDDDESFQMASPAASPSERLYVNTSSEHYMLEMDEPTGLDQLMALSFSSPIEEAWLFIVMRDSKGQDRYYWYEVGENETEGSVENNLTLFEEFFSLHKDRIQSVHHYHIHPRSLPETMQMATESGTLPSKEDWSFLFHVDDILKSIIPSVNFAVFPVSSDGVWWLDHESRAGENPLDEITQLYACLEAVDDPTIQPEPEIASLVDQIRGRYVPSESPLEEDRQGYILCASETSLQPKYYWEGQLDSIPPIIRPSNDGE